MDSVETLIVGAGISGLATAAFSPGKDCLILEADAEMGGYCKTIKRGGFTWDYSGHFFHFKHPEIEGWVRARMPGQHILNVVKRSLIAYKGDHVDFPFQKNIHQLPREEFIDCLHDLFFAHEAATRGEAAAPSNFKEMLYARLGRSIAEKFLVPYNEKLYACDLATLDQDAMGRFFPHANLADIVRNMKTPDPASYNSVFTYPEGGAIEYVKALASAVPDGSVALSEALLAVDLKNKIARTTKREIRFARLVSSAPLAKFAALCGVPHDPSVFTWNKVLVFNLGFDRKGPTNVHWTYFPDRDLAFYRVGFYDNIFESDRMSLYVEIGYARDAVVDVEAARTRVLADLAKAGVVTDHRLIAEHNVVMDPAYVHITRASLAETARLKTVLAAHDVHTIGRYGGWTYCSIEDNIVEARALAATFA
ncbi:MAG TPA: NAD(P)-binding protein [Polyangia bacterium]